MRTYRTHRSSIYIALASSLAVASFVACSSGSRRPTRGVDIRFEIARSALNLDGYAMHPLHIGLKLSGPSEVSFKDAVQAGQMVSLELPVGTVKIESVALMFAIPQGSSVMTEICQKGSGTGPRIYSAVASAPFEVTPTTSEVPVTFPALTNLVDQQLGFYVTDDQGGPALGAKVYVLDPVSEKPIIDPCTGQPFSKDTASNGKVAIDFPFFAGSALSIAVEHNGRRIPFRVEIANINPSVPTFASFKLNMANASTETMSGDFNGNGLDDATDFTRGLRPFHNESSYPTSSSTSTYTGGPSYPPIATSTSPDTNTYSGTNTYYGTETSTYSYTWTGTDSYTYTGSSSGTWTGTGTSVATLYNVTSFTATGGNQPGAVSLNWTYPSDVSEYLSVEIRRAEGNVAPADCVGGLQVYASAGPFTGLANTNGSHMDFSSTTPGGVYSYRFCVHGTALE